MDKRRAGRSRICGAPREADRANVAFGVKDLNCARRADSTRGAQIHRLYRKCQMDSSAGMREVAPDPASPSRIPVDLREVSLGTLRVRDNDIVRHMVTRA